MFFITMHLNIHSNSDPTCYLHKLYIIWKLRLCRVQIISLCDQNSPDWIYCFIWKLCLNLSVLKPLYLCSTSLYWRQILTQALIRCCAVAYSNIGLLTDNALVVIHTKTWHLFQAGIKSSIYSVFKLSLSQQSHRCYLSLGTINLKALVVVEI